MENNLSSAHQVFIIVDGNAILHRAFHAMPELTTSKGELINAVFGFTSIILKIFTDFHPEYVACCFDKKAPTKRKEMFADYQIKRPKMDEDLVGQIERVHEVVRALNIPIFELDGYEADDVIGTLVGQAIDFQKTQKTQKVRKSDNPNVRISENLASDLSEFSGKNNLEVIIVTGDRDLLQLVSDSVRVYLPTRGLSQAALFDEKLVENKMGVKPALIPDLKGLVGDQSDNYPGVPGIGPKTATELLKKYGGFREIFDKLDEDATNGRYSRLSSGLDKFEPAIAKKLRAGQEMGELSYKLAQIMKDVPVKLKLEDCKLTDYDWEKAAELFDELEFRSLIPRLPKAGVIEKQEAKKEEEKQMGLF